MLVNRPRQWFPGDLVLAPSSVLLADSHRSSARPARSDSGEQVSGGPVVRSPVFRRAYHDLKFLPGVQLNEGRPHSVTDDLPLVLTFGCVCGHHQHLFDRRRRPAKTLTMGFESFTPWRNSTFVEVLGDGIKGLAGKDAPCCLLHNWSLILMGFNPEQGARFRILDASVAYIFLPCGRPFSALERMSRCRRLLVLALSYSESTASSNRVRRPRALAGS